MHRGRLRGFLAVLLFFPLSWATAGAAPQLAFAGHGLVGSGFSPGGQVIWFGLTQEVVAYEVTYARHQEAGPVDGKGQASFDLGKAVPRRSLWVAVDLASGAYAIATPPGFELTQTELPATALTYRGSSLADQISDEADGSLILLVRPGQGAWGAAVGRGGLLDESLPTETAVRVSLDRLEPIVTIVTSLGSPQKAAARDLLVIFHPQTMSAAVAVVGGRP